LADGRRRADSAELMTNHDARSGIKTGGTPGWPGFQLSLLHNASLLTRANFSTCSIFGPHLESDRNTIERSEQWPATSSTDLGIEAVAGVRGGSLPVLVRIRPVAGGNTERCTGIREQAEGRGAA
jgi:hypothetical protein